MRQKISHPTKKGYGKSFFGQKFPKYVWENITLKGVKGPILRDYTFEKIVHLGRNHKLKRLRK